LIHIKATGTGPHRIGLMLVESGTLAEHHRRCDVLFAAARQSAMADVPDKLRAHVAELREALLAHFRYEEEHVFPLYEQACGEAGACGWLCAQHDDMRGILWMLATASAEEDRMRYRADLAELQALFEAHAADEESRMYPLFERLLGR
jgi:hemerythrin superfamily protein